MINQWKHAFEKSKKMKLKLLLLEKYLKCKQLK